MPSTISKLLHQMFKLIDALDLHKRVAPAFNLDNLEYLELKSLHVPQPHPVVSGTGVFLSIEQVQHTPSLNFRTT